MTEGWEQIQPRLLPGEQPLWSGRPDPAKWFGPSDLFIVPFSIIWCTFVIFFEVNAISSTNSPVFFILWGVFNGFIGLYFVIGRFFVKRRGKITTLYALTSQRALIFRGNNSFADSPIAGTAISVERSRDGKHVTVKFGAQGSSSLFSNRVDYSNTGLEFFGAGRARQFAFYDVVNPDEVDSALNKARAHADRPRN